LPLLQLQQVPQDPLHPHFVQLLERVSYVINTTGWMAALQLLSLDLVPALQGWLLRLGAHATPAASSQSSQGASSGAEGGSQGSQGASSGVEGSSQGSQGAASAAEGSSQSSTVASPTPPSASSSSGTAPAEQRDLDTACTILTSILTALRVVFEFMVLGEKTAAGDDDLALVTIEQLLSSPAAMKVAVHQGLSAEVQEAAKEGRAAAVNCAAAACLFFRRAAAALSMIAGVPQLFGVGRARALSGQLAGFLQAEENLPFLEPLCLPPAHCEPHAVL
jgi:hypothetical protein